MEETNIRYNFDSFEMIVFIKKKFKFLLIISLLGAIISGIVSLVIPEKYKSSVVMFPAPSTSISKSLLTDNITAKTVSKFGDEEEVEQLLQVLNSDEIRERIKEKYNLMEHYNIQENDKYKHTNFLKKYNNNIKCKRTEFMSIEIEVLDINNQMAADIANDIAALVDTVMMRMEHERAQEAFEIVENEYLTLQKQINTLSDSLTKIRQKGVIDYESQAEVFNKAYADALASNNTAAITKFEDKLTVLAQYGGAYVAIRDFLTYETEQLSVINARYAEAKVEATAQLTHKMVVNSAYPSDKKSYPIRWLIVVLSTIATAILATLTLITIDIFKRESK